MLTNLSIKQSSKNTIRHNIAVNSAVRHGLSQRDNTHSEKLMSTSKRPKCSFMKVGGIELF